MKNGTTSEIPAVVREQIECLRTYRPQHLQFPERLEKSRLALIAAEQDLAQAKKDLADAQSIAQADALMGDGLSAEELKKQLGNESQRKAAIAKALSECPVCKVCADNVHKRTLLLAQAQSSMDTVKDQWKAIQYAQTAAIKIVDAYQIFKPEVNNASNH